MLLSFLFTNLIHAEEVETMGKALESVIKMADSIPKAIVSENADKDQLEKKIKAEQAANKSATQQTQKTQRTQQNTSNKNVVSPSTSESKDTSTGMDQNTMNWIVIGSLLGVALFGLTLIIIAKCMK